MPRPFKTKHINELEALYIQKRNEASTLRALLDELQFRSVPRAIALRKKVEDRIRELLADQEAEPTLHPELLFEPKLEGDGLQSLPNDQSSLEAEAEPSLADIEETSDAQDFAQVQPPPVAERPAQFRPQLQRDVHLETLPGDSQVKIFRIAIAALIREMRQRRIGQQSFLLENGVAVSRDAGGCSYQFAFAEQATLFEDAKVDILIGGRTVIGHLTAIREAQGTIVITIQEDFGDRIVSCVLRIDATALLQALHDRLEKIEKGEVPAFRGEFATRVLNNEGTADNVGTELPLPGETLLNDRQREFVRVALSKEISWLWGPPGTGKTRALGVLTRLLFDSGKRVLICSNTNQAVDQLLLQLCKQMKDANEPALFDGKVLRLGRIDHDELEESFHDLISVEGIVARRSQAMSRRKAEVEFELTHLNNEVASAEEILRMFARADRASEAEVSAARELSLREAEENRVSAEYQRFDLAYGTLVEELTRRRGAGALRRMLMRSEDAILRELGGAEQRLKETEDQLKQASSTVATQRTQYAELRKAAAALAQEVSGRDRTGLQRLVEEADARRRPLRDELAQISKELESLRDRVISEARIVGATITRTYLRPNEFAALDIVIIDEASMILLPMAFYAAGLSTERIVIAGDFRQLPPILQTEQQEIHETLALDIFERAGITKAISSKRHPAGLVMLVEQYRMHQSFGSIVSKVFYESGGGDALRPADPRQSSAEPPALPRPFAQRITIVDTSRVWPFAVRDAFKSRFNLMHALAVRNLVLHLRETGYLVNESLGVCTPYSAQAKLIGAILKAHEIDEKLVRTRTAHGFQGDERGIMVIDLVDSIGERNVGIFLQAESLDDVGAKLQNVALSRAKESIVVITNLTFLEGKLPGNAKLRTVLYELQRRGRVLDVREVLALRPVFDDLHRFSSIAGLSAQSLKDGLFNGNDFARLARLDMQAATHSIVIFSGFITPQRIAHMGDLLRQRIAAGVRVRCVTRPPDRNGTIPVEEGRKALKALEAIGVVVDLRFDIHEKVVLIDNRITWFGSLNPLSHTARTTELMGRVEDPGFTKQVAVQLSLRRRPPEELERLGATEGENPRCPCGGWSVLRRSRFGRFFSAEDGCGWTQDVDRPVRQSRNGSR